MKIALPPSFTMLSATAWPRFSLRPVIVTLAPSLANRIAVAWPMPDVPPVIRATLCSNRILLACPRQASAIHHQRRSGYERRRIAGEIKCGLSDLFRCADTPQRATGGLRKKSIFRYAQLPRLAAQHRGIGVTGADAVHPNFLAAMVNRHGFREQNDRALRSTVARCPPPPRQSPARSRVDNRTSAHIRHEWNHFAGHKKDGFYIHRHHRVPIVLTDLNHGGAADDACIVEQDVNATEFL